LVFWAAGWTDWNLALDAIGGPNHLQNYCDSPVIANITAQTLLFQPMFYYMGQISKFVRPGYVRVNSQFQITLSDPDATNVQSLVASGSNAVMWQCNNSPNQRWDYDESTQQIKLHQNQSVDQPPLCLNIQNSANVRKKID
jgi:O-glycosyl hydrolase